MVPFRCFVLPCALVLTLDSAFAAEPALNDAPAVEAAAPLLKVQPAKWEANQAPGFTAAPAPDAEQTWMPLHGWIKVPSGAPSATAVPLPDPWQRSRTYQAAWYILRADFGAKLPEVLNLRFDAVAHQCEAFVNGARVGGHIGGFTPFAFDITRAAHPGLNTIALYVRDEHAVEFEQPVRAVSQVGPTRPGAFGSAAGICGGVYFDARPAAHTDHLLIHTSTRRNEIEVTTWLAAPAPENATISHTIYPWPLGEAAALQIPVTPVAAGQTSQHVQVPWTDALRWSPEHPNLYVLRTTVTAGGRSETVETRFGFREFWTEGKSFVLNGTPIRLLGTSLAHDTDLVIAGSPEAGRRYARAAFTFLKREYNYRAMRLHASIHPPEAIQAADEAGFLLIDQSSIWSAMGAAYSKGGDAFMRNTQSQFTEWFWRDANNPSVVIFDLENEMIRGSRAPDRMKWVLQLDSFIKDLDPTRITEHSGAAWYSPTQQTIHVHMKEQYNAILRTWQESGNAPLIFGEFWIGGQSGENRLPDGYEHASRLDWQQDESRLYRERILEMRNYGASGVMPFWMDDVILGRTHESLWRAYDPAKDQIYFSRYPQLRNLGALALNPIIGFAWPRGQSVAAGTSLHREIVVCNDREEAVTLNIGCELAGQKTSWRVRLDPGAQDRHAISIPVFASGDLIVTVKDDAGQSYPGDQLAIHAVAAGPLQPAATSRRLVVAPKPTPAVASELRELGLVFDESDSIPSYPDKTILLVPPGQARDALGRSPKAIRDYLIAGGRLLVLDQNQAPAWLPLNLPFWSATGKSAPEFGMLGWPPYTKNLFYSPEIPLYADGHPAFAGLAPNDFRRWNSQDGRISDDAFTRPAAIDIHTGAAYRVLAGGCRRENASLIEAQIGSGTAILCQVQVLEQSEAPPARALLQNLLRYLDGPAWRSADASVGLAGNLTPTRLAALTGLPADRFIPVPSDAGAPALILAGDHADPAALNNLARAGHTVLVLSRETVSRMPGYTVSHDDDAHYAGTRSGIADDPLFWGIASGNFLPLEESPANGSISSHPSDARVLLGGLSDIHPPGFWKGHPQPIELTDGDGVIAVAEARGAGSLIATTIEPWNPGLESHRQLLSTLLANAGIRLPVEAAGRTDVLAKATVPIRIDGKLDDWTNDLDDRNVSPFQHAEPIALTSRDVVAGKVGDDLDLSGILYLLHDDQNLYVSGIVFSSDEGADVEFDLADRQIVVDLDGKSLTLNGKPVPGSRLATGRAAAHEISDTRLLSLVQFDVHVDRMIPATDSPGTTFEASIPWSAFGTTRPPLTFPARFLVRRGTATLQVPDSSLTVRLGR